jgi:hypothetical protein
MTSEAPILANRRIAKKRAGPHSDDSAKQSQFPEGLLYKQSQFPGSVSREWRP